MKLLLALLVIAPVVLLVVSAVRGRVRVRSCCAVPAEQDARLSTAYAATTRHDAAPDATTRTPDAAAH